MKGLHKIFRPFPFYRQHDSKDCGPTCLRMIAAYHGISISLESLRAWCGTRAHGTSIEGILIAAKRMGFLSDAVKVPPGNLHALHPPFIGYQNNRHFAVIYKITGITVFIADPAKGKFKLTTEEFHKWCGLSGDAAYTLLIFEPHAPIANQAADTRSIIRFLLKIAHGLPELKRKLINILLLSLIAIALHGATPLMAQAVVDKGIGSASMNVVAIFALGHVAAACGRSLFGLLKGWILLRTSQIIYQLLMVGYLKRMFSLPIAFFDSRSVGDILIRFNDIKSLMELYVKTSIEFIVSLISLSLFSIILAVYSLKLLAALWLVGALFFGWTRFFAGRRLALAALSHDRTANEKNIILDISKGILDVKLHGAESFMIDQWKRESDSGQENLCATQRLTHKQNAGAWVLEQAKYAAIICITANEVINNRMSIGMMVATNYIVGQISSPLSNITSISQSMHMTSLSVGRILEVYNLSADETPSSTQSDSSIPAELTLNDIVFAHEGRVNTVVNHVSCSFRSGKITAIVGASGAGKSTLIKLLLGIYKPKDGEILIDGKKFDLFNNSAWFCRCAAVTQDGYIFSATLKANVLLGQDPTNNARFSEALRTACVDEFIGSLPLGVDTPLGTGGQKLSEGQRQRILLARALVKPKPYLFLDEATSALDPVTESKIFSRLRARRENSTVIITTHRINTLREVDHIIVLEDGSLVEEGTFSQLVAKRGKFSQQLETQSSIGHQKELGLAI